MPSSRRPAARPPSGPAAGPPRVRLHGERSSAGGSRRGENGGEEPGGEATEATASRRSSPALAAAATPATAGRAAPAGGPGSPAPRAPYGNGSTAIRSRRTPLTGRAVVLAIVLVVLALSFAYPLRGWFDQRAQLSALNEQTIAQQRKIAELTTELERWDDPAFVQTQARSRLRFVMPGEASFVVLGDDVVNEEALATAEDLAAPGGEPVPVGSAWWERLWSTVDQADTALLPETVEPAGETSTPPTAGATPGATPGASSDPGAEPSTPELPSTDGAG